MKVVILAGGFGTRLSEETDIRPKPMVEIGGKPILWHIMKIYSSFGFHEFVILLGYKGYYIKEYFANYFLHQSDVTIDLASGTMDVHRNSSEPWKVTLVDTGLETLTGGRVLRAKDIIGNETFMLTYGDGVGNVNIKQLLASHKKNQATVTMTTVQPEGRFGAVSFDDAGNVRSFMEKPKGDGAWINAGFFVCEPDIFNYLDNDQTILEQKPLQTLAHEGKLFAYKHEGFWKPMDTLRDKIKLNELWENGLAEWKIWND